MNRWIVRLSAWAGLGAAVFLAAVVAAQDSSRSTPLRERALTVPPGGHAGFTLLDAALTGIRFTNHLSNEAVAANQIRLIGSGVALGDVDGDGLCDIYLCRQEGPNVLYRNLGNWKFEDITGRAGVGCADQFSTGCVLADVDGDGDLDLLVNGLGAGTRLFLNDGRGRFTESTDSGLARRSGSTSLALADVDGDGDLDLYVANYRSTTVRSTGIKVLVVNGRKVIRPEDRDQYEFTSEGMLLEHGEVDVLYLNDGHGHFAPVPWTGGAFLDEDGQPLAAGPKDWGLSARFHDINGDGRPDLYVCNDFWSPDRVWLNESHDGHVRFRAAPRLALRHTSTFSMGVDFADINRDGFDDFMVLDMLSRDHPRRLRQRSAMGQLGNGPARWEERVQVERNTLFLNRGDGTYADIAEAAGVQASEWSWGVVFLDVDLDGFEDLLITTGHGFDTQDSDTEARLATRGPEPDGLVGRHVLEFPPLQVPKVAFRNRGDLTFEECASRWGFDQPGVAHGIAVADLDNDGDLDVVVNQLNGPAAIYRNETSAPRVLIQLRGRPPNTRGIGAKIRFLGGPVPQSQEIIAGGRYLSGDEVIRVFAAGRATGGMACEVTWRDGARSVLKDLRPNHAYVIQEPAPAAEPFPLPAPRARPVPFFTEVTSLTHTHQDEPFQDFSRQPLLPRRLSQLGPGVSWIDVDGDGHDDLLVGTGGGGSVAIFRNRGDGGFDPMRVGGVLGHPREDVTSIVAWSPSTGVTALWVGQANYETGDATLPAAHRFDLRAGRMTAGEALPGLGSSPGPIAIADVDGDGDVDVFVGGRVMAGRYPEPATSRLYRNEPGRMVLAQEWPRLGLVSGAVFSDLTGDGLPELILATEWGPLQLFRNVNGRLEPWDPELTGSSGFPWPTDAVPAGGTGDVRGKVTLSRLRGWWNGVATGDFDGDGRLDIVAANWGENTPCQPFIHDGWRIHFGDLAGRGEVEMLEAFNDTAHGRVAPWRDLDAVAQSMPRVRERFPSNALYAEAGVAQVLGDHLGTARELRVNWLRSTVFLNRGDHFEVRTLPFEAQLAPAFGLCIGDLDGDGHEDLLLSQNFFGVAPGDARLDAGRGLWLRGDGQGKFSAVPGDESGLRLYGEQRGAALGDFDEDGRVDCAIAQNSGPTKLLHNDRARPGLRIRLRGPEGNLTGLGAMLRWRSAAGADVGAAREIHGGSGYWSQDSAVQILARPADAAGLSIRWPGGRTTLSEVPPGLREVTVDAEGKILGQRPE